MDNNPLLPASRFLAGLAYRKDLSASEVREVLNTVGDFDEIKTLGESDGYYFLALVLGLMAKGPTADELLGFVQSIADHSVRFDAGSLADKLIDVSGTGGDRVKTLNVGTACSFVLVAGGVPVAKQATRGYTGFTGSATVLQEFGLDPFSVPQEDVLRMLQESGFVAIYTPAYSRGFKNRIDFLTRLRNIGLTFPTPWHLVSWVYSPFPLRYRLYGVFDYRFARPIAELYRLLGYRHVYVVHGEPGLDEFSVCGRTSVCELADGEIREWSIQPEDVGIATVPVERITTLDRDDDEALLSSTTAAPTRNEIRTRGVERSIAHFLETLYGTGDAARIDLVCLNAAAGFALTGAAPSLTAGLPLARKMVHSGEASRTFERIVKKYGSSDKLRDWKSRLKL